jgi:hypothetical protein
MSLIVTCPIIYIDKPAKWNKFLSIPTWINGLGSNEVADTDQNNNYQPELYVI